MFSCLNTTLVTITIAKLNKESNIWRELSKQSSSTFYISPHLRPLSFFNVPPYLGLVPIKSIISGIQLANIAYTRQQKDKQDNIRIISREHRGTRNRLLFDVNVKQNIQNHFHLNLQKQIFVKNCISSKSKPLNSWKKTNSYLFFCFVLRISERERDVLRRDSWVGGSAVYEIKY